MISASGAGSWSEGPVTVHLGDCLEVLRQLPAASVHCVVTSPPYWGLRDYGAEGQLGLEATPEQYVSRLVDIFAEVRRVLRPDGVAWLNLGDSYANDAKWGGSSGGKHAVGLYGKTGVGRGKRETGLKAKDLVGIPWRVALALQADGWWLRSDVIWSKPNPMPESVTDRPTRSHEYVFLLTRSDRYFYDADAVREDNVNPAQTARALQAAKPSAVFDDRARATGQPGNVNNVGIHGRPGSIGRNCRSVWTIATQPYPQAHFATMPPELARRCIAAGTSERGCCPQCGAPWQRVVERSGETSRERLSECGPSAYSTSQPTRGQGLDHSGRHDTMRESRTIDWRAACTHDREPVACTVLDPFCGSGTTLAVARRMGRKAVGIELQGSYLSQIQCRVSGAALPLLELISV